MTLPKSSQSWNLWANFIEMEQVLQRKSVAFADKLNRFHVATPFDFLEPSRFERVLSNSNFKSNIFNGFILPWLIHRQRCNEFLNSDRVLACGITNMHEQIRFQSSWARLQLQNSIESAFWARLILSSFSSFSISAKALSNVVHSGLLSAGVFHFSIRKDLNCSRLCSVSASGPQNANTRLPSWRKRRSVN